MSPHEMKELPKESEDELDEVAILISDDEDDGGDEPEPLADPDPEPLLLDVENELEEDVPEEDEEDDEEEPDEEDNDDADDDDDDETSEGAKEDDDDSDDEADDEDKRPYIDSDDNDEDDDNQELGLAGRALQAEEEDDEEVDDEDDDDDDDNNDMTVRMKKVSTVKRSAISRGKVMPGVSFPLSTRREYKGDIEDLLRAAAQADEGETSTGNNNIDGINSLITAAIEREDRAVAGASLKGGAVFDILHNDEGDGLLKDSVGKDNIADDGNPPVKRIKNS